MNAPIRLVGNRIRLVSTIPGLQGSFEGLFAEPAKLQLVDLSWTGLREGIEKFNGTGHFVVDEPFAAIAKKLFGGKRAPGFKHNECFRNLTPEGILHTHGRHFKCVGMTAEDLVDFSWIDVVTTGEDQFLLSVHHKEITLVVQIT